MVKDYKKSKEILLNLLKENPNSIGLITLLAQTYFKNGEVDNAMTTIAQLSSFQKPYQYGEIEYAYASYYAATNQNDLALNYLKRSIAKGNRFTINTFQNDADFINLFADSRFDEILTYWH